MKYAGLFIIFLLIGFFGFIAYLKYSKPAPPVLSSTPEFSVETPPKKSLQGTIATMSGELEWQSRTATEPAKLTEPQPALQGTEFWTKDKSKIDFQFPQVGEISLGENTHISFVQTLPDHFVVVQNTGAAVYKLVPSAAPLSVRSHTLLIQQNAGEMTVELANTIDVSVKSGSATLAFNDVNNTSTVVTVNQGEKYSFDTEKKEGKISRLRE